MDPAQFQLSWDYHFTSSHLTFGGMAACDSSAHMVRNFLLLEVSAWVDVCTRSPLSFSSCGCSIISRSCFWGFFWSYMLRGNLLSLSTIKYLTFSLLLKAFHASCTSSSYRFFSSTPIHFIFPAVTKFFGKRANFKSAISPSSELRFNQFFFEFGYFSARNPNLLFVSKNFAQKVSDLLWKHAAQNSKLWNLL